MLGAVDRAPLRWLGIKPHLSVRDRFPDQFGNIDDEIRFGLIGIYWWTPHFANANAHRIVEARIPIIIGLVEHGANDLAPPNGIGPAIPVPLEHENGSVVGLDHGAEVRTERPIRAMTHREIRTSKPPADIALATTFRKKERLYPASLQLDFPTLGIRKPDPVQGRQTHSPNGNGCRNRAIRQPTRRLVHLGPQGLRAQPIPECAAQVPSIRAGEGVPVRRV